MQLCNRAFFLYVRENLACCFRGLWWACWGYGIFYLFFKKKFTFHAPSDMRLAAVKVIMDKISKRSKGYGFIEYASEEAAAAALEEMNGKVLLGSYCYEFVLCKNYIWRVDVLLQIINGWMIVVVVAKANPPRYGRDSSIMKWRFWKALTAACREVGEPWMHRMSWWLLRKSVRILILVKWLL